VWVDKAAESVRIDFRGGIDKTYFIKVSRPYGSIKSLLTTVSIGAAPAACCDQHST
jgi:hypothetical protein